MTALIRAADLSDAGALARIHADCFAVAWDEEAFRGFVNNPGMLTLAAQDAAATDLQAFILVQIAADESEIISLGTHASARRTGLAHALLASALVEAAQRGARTMFLEVAEDNSAALALYHRCGFTLQGRRRSYYERPDGPADALLLRRSLA